MSDKPRAIGVLNGSGGVAIGFERAGFETVGVIEADDDYGTSYRLNRPDVIHHVQEPAEWTVDQLEALYPGISDEIYAVYGHPPCQGVSGMNAVAAEDNPKNMRLVYTAKLGMELGATHVVMENIPRMLSLGAPYVAQVRELCHHHGYSFEAHKHYAGHFGVSQKRRRVMFVLSKKGHEISWPSEPHHEPPNVWDAIGDMNDVDVQTEKGVEIEYAGPAQSDLQEMLRNPDGVTWNHYLLPLPENYQHIEQGKMWKTLPRELMTDKERAKIDRGSFYNAAELVRLHEKRVGPTLTGAKNRMHPRQCRRLSVREAARLMGFPDTWRWASDDNYQQIAAGVCPPVAEWFARVIGAQVGAAEMPKQEWVLF